MRGWRRLAAVMVTAVLAGLGATPAAAADHGIQVLSSQQLDGRLTELTLSTPAHRERKPRRYPVLYLLHAVDDGHVQGQIETAGKAHAQVETGWLAS